MINLDQERPRRAASGAIAINGWRVVKAAARHSLPDR
jgi:hypothetical protein